MPSDEVPDPPAWEWEPSLAVQEWLRKLNAMDPEEFDAQYNGRFITEYTGACPITVTISDVRPLNGR